MKKIALFSLLALLSPLFGEKPNIIYILADDLGYGDVKAFNVDRCLIDTPHMDKLAKEGMMFTNTHTGSSVCTPTRYGVLTGRYSWRTKLQSSVLFGFGQPLISQDTTTVPSLLKKNGYTTAMIGKWHLGLGFVDKTGKPPKGKQPQPAPSDIDWGQTITGGPVDLGFDSWEGISASLDMPPYIWIKDNKFVGECTTTKAFHRPGPAHADFEAVDILSDFGDKSEEYIKNYDSENPFFMYIPLTSPHAPIVPSDEWKGKSKLGAYGDFVMMTDAIVGQIVDAVDAKGIKENTIIIVTSDNGCSRVAGSEEKGIVALEEQGHYPSGVYRGSKSDIWEGGHRVPFIVRWPKVVEAGSTNNELLSTVDLMATCAEIVGAELAEDEGVDSISFLPVLKGEPVVSTRKGIVTHSVSGQFAYTMGKWKMLTVKGSGGWTRESPINSTDSPFQLYDLDADPGEQNNLFETNKKTFVKLVKQLKEDMDRGRSTAGVNQKNDVPIRFRGKAALKVKAK